MSYENKNNKAIYSFSTAISQITINYKTNTISLKNSELLFHITYMVKRNLWFYLE